VIGAAMMDWGAAAADVDGLHDEVKRFALRAKPQDWGLIRCPC